MRAAEWASLSVRVEMTLAVHGRGKAAGGDRASPGRWRISRRVWPGGAMQAAHGANQTGGGGAGSPRPYRAGHRRQRGWGGMHKGGKQIHHLGEVVRCVRIALQIWGLFLRQSGYKGRAYQP